MTKIDIEHVAKIARLSLTSREKKKLEKDLQEIIKAFDILDKIKTNEKPSFQPIEINDVMRDDKIIAPLSQKEALSNTKHKEKGFFKGPRAV